MGWDKKPDLFAELLEEEADKRYRAFALTCLNTVVLRSPVDTGRFRGSHIVSAGSPDDAVTDAADKTGTMTLDAGAAVIRGVPKGSFPPLYIQTNLPYAARLENGWSKQAADGVYAVSFNYAVQKFR
ncbi:hypothetical protein [Neisseria bacilliformis]|uniref:hypothetical protein n=1 Tax=Neisseria bacilliformis TaxID=267212 RepID=UPI003C770579